MHYADRAEPKGQRGTALDPAGPARVLWVATTNRATNVLAVTQFPEANAFVVCLTGLPAKLRTDRAAPALWGTVGAADVCGVQRVTDSRPEHIRGGVTMETRGNSQMALLFQKQSAPNTSKPRAGIL